jgi:cytochrome c553
MHCRAARNFRAVPFQSMVATNFAALWAVGEAVEGVRDIPRLGGLAYFYLKGRLEQWGKGYHSGVESPMPLVASHLGPDEIDALASYLSFVK